MLVGNKKGIMVYCIVITLLILIIIFVGFTVPSKAQLPNGFHLADSKLDIQEVATQIDRPTSFAFLGPDDLLILEQYKGTVLRIKNGTKLAPPLLDVNVGNSSERGMLGISIIPNLNGNSSVFLYYTEAESRDGGPILGNRLYRYTFVDDPNGGKLVDRTLLLDLPGLPNLPGNPGQDHNGGKIAIGPDGNIYLTIGDVRRKTVTQNLANGGEVDGSGGILRVRPNGHAIGEGIIGTTHPANKYFAYGIRNSFGIDFDPITGYLWNTENGPSINDEINLVTPGFNSGWQTITGFAKNDSQTWPPLTQEELLSQAAIHLAYAVHEMVSLNASGAEAELQVARGQLEEVLDKSKLLYDFEGKGEYSDPEFVWNQTVAPTAIQFFNSQKYGNEYLNKMFVAEYQTGKLLCFSLDVNRTELKLGNELSDQIANSWDETNSVAFGKGFDGITDIKVGPDGFLYITERNSGTLSRIIPQLTGHNDTKSFACS